MTGIRFSLHQLNPALRDKAIAKLRAQATVRDHTCEDDKPSKAAKLPKLSEPEERLAFHMRAEGIKNFVRQFKWHPERKFLADFAWPELKLIVEVQGGVHIRGARSHTGRKGYEQDRARTNEAVILGYRILEFTPHQIKNGYAIRTVRRALGVL